MHIAFVYFMIHETESLTLEHEDEPYNVVKIARKSVGWISTTTFRRIRASVAAQGGRHGHNGVKGNGEKLHKDV